MNDRTPELEVYAAPRLKVYGTVADVTLTNANDKNKNDSVQGQNNLKT